MLQIGDRAPEFSLLNQDEDTISSEKLLGKKYLLWFYPKASTPGWTIQGQGFRDELNEFSELGIKIFGVSADSVKRQKNFHTKQNFNFDLLSDESHVMLEKYGVWGLKKFMGREYMGISRITYIIDEKGFVASVFEKVKTKTHANDVLNDL